MHSYKTLEPVLLFSPSKPIEIAQENRCENEKHKQMKEANEKKKRRLLNQGINCLHTLISIIKHVLLYIYRNRSRVVVCWNALKIL